MSLLILNIAFGVVILGLSLYKLLTTPHNMPTLTRLSLSVLAVGAFSTASGFLYGYTSPEWSEILFKSGAALLLVSGWIEQRKLANTPNDGSALPRTQ